MALINIVINTENREPILSIDGQSIPNAEFYASCYIGSDGEKSLSFDYTIRVVNEMGLTERKTYTLPPKDVSVNTAELAHNTFILKENVQNSRLDDDIKKFFSKEASEK